VRRFAHSLNVSLQGSKLRVQIQTDTRYATFVQRAIVGDVLDVKLPVAQLDDLLKGKIWAASDPEQRASKRLKDLADIARLIENYPQLRSEVPQRFCRSLYSYPRFLAAISSSMFTSSVG